MQSAAPGTASGSSPSPGWQWMIWSSMPCAISTGTGEPSAVGTFGNGWSPSGPGMFQRIQSHHAVMSASEVVAHVSSAPPLKNCPAR